MDKETGLTKADWQDALDVQNACNLSGVVRYLCDVVNRIWEESRENGGGTEYVNQHPIVRLYVDKLASLAGIQRNDLALGDAYNECYRQTKD